IAIAAGAVSTAALPAAAADGVAKRAAKGELRPAVLKMQVQKDGQTVTVTRPMPFLSSGTLSAAAEALAATNQGDERAAAADAGPAGDLGANPVGSGPGTLGCDRDSAGNVRVNQDCTFRR